MTVLNEMVGQLFLLRKGEMALLFAFVTILYFVLNAIYRVTFHPLAKYPGPFLQKISGWPLIVHCWSGNRHIKLLEAHQRYGPIVRISPSSLSFNTLEAFQAVHVSRNANVGRDEWYKSLDISSGAYSTQSCMDKQEHLFRRRVLSEAFSERALRDAEGFVRNNVLLLCDRVGRGAEKPGQWTPRVNLGSEATYFGFDFISDLTFGRAFGLMVDEGPRYIPGVLMWTSQFLYAVGFLPFRALVRPFMGTSIQNYIGGKAAANALRYQDLANARVAERVALEEHTVKFDKQNRRDVYHYLLHARDPETGKGFTKEEFQADSALLIAAGSDGVAVAIASCIFYLLHNPSTYTKLTGEIRSSFGSVEEIRTPKLNSLPYLLACIQEAMRISPPLPSGFPRVVLPGGLTIPSSPVDEDCRPVYIPAGTTVFVPFYALHHNEAYYPDSWAFRPDRWIVSSSDPTSPSATSATLVRRAFSTFGAGPMNCAGKSMAYLALKLALANLLWKYDVRLAKDVAEDGKRAVVTGPMQDWEMGPTGGGHVDAKMEGRRRPGEYQMVDFMAAYRDGPTVEFRERV